MSLRTIESLRRVELSTTLVTPRLEALGQLAAQSYVEVVESLSELLPLNFSPGNMGMKERSFLYRQKVAEQDLAFIADALFYAKPKWESDLPPELRWAAVAGDLLERKSHIDLNFVGEDKADLHASIYRGFIKRVSPPMPHGRRGLSYARDVAEGRRVLRPLPRTILH